jgi:hypothetical protein
MMVDGLKVLMSSEELAQRLSERILWHQQMVEEYEEERANAGTHDEAASVPEHVLEHQMHEHQEQAATLTMLRDHLIPKEIYGLTESDLRFADLVPEFHMEYSMSWRRGSQGSGPGAGALREP